MSKEKEAKEFAYWLIQQGGEAGILGSMYKNLEFERGVFNEFGDMISGYKNFSNTPIFSKLNFKESGEDGDGDFFTSNSKSIDDLYAEYVAHSKNK